MVRHVPAFAERDVGLEEGRIGWNILLRHGQFEYFMHPHPHPHPHQGPPRGFISAMPDGPQRLGNRQRGDLAGRAVARLGKDYASSLFQL